MKDKIVSFVKKEIVLVFAFILSVVSAFLVHPSKEYLGYIDYRVLGILLSLVIVMAGLQSNGFLESVGIAILRRTKSIRGLLLMLSLLCFFTSMLITNDVALITFVPFTVMIMRRINGEKYLLPLVALETIAANLGSMLTPIGNPQNLYLYNVGGYSIGEFVLLILPYASLSLVLVVVSSLILARKNVSIQSSEVSKKELERKSKIRNAIYLALFVLCILVVIKIIPYYYVLILCVLITLIMERDVLLKVDYCLLLTFVFFFIFTGNLGRVPYINDLLEKMIVGNEVWMSILVSQGISNVPCALLLSKFTSNYSALVVGVNIGGLGTLIASMASLISYKIYVNEYNDKKTRYIICFSVMSIIFLAFLYSFSVILSRVG